MTDGRRIPRPAAERRRLEYLGDDITPESSSRDMQDGQRTRDGADVMIEQGGEISGISQSN